MKAIVIDRYGSSGVLRERDVEKPSVQDDRVLVKVGASSVNPVDWKIRRGDLQLLSGFRFPLHLGCDLAGVVEAVGNRVSQFRPGDQVYTFTNPIGGGAYAEYVTVPATSLALKPRNMTFEEAAAVPLAGLTALQGLLDEGQLRPGQKVLINGASGGVGTFAVQIAKAMSAEVTGVCSAKNVELVLGLGVDHVIDYTQQDFTRGDIRYDLIFDAVATRSFSECAKVLQPQGIYVSTLPAVENLGAMVQSLIFPGQKSKFILVKPNSRDLNALRELIEAGKVRSTIDRTFPLSEIAAAHTYSETGRAVGKIVVTLDTSDR
jgi:NADPH:quinone reductase-like Zn-dependent oxidoreductase